MRTLQTHDLFKFCRVAKEMGIKDELRELCLKSNNIKDVAENGFDFIYGIFDKATSEKSEAALFVFLSDIFEEDPQVIADSDPVDFLNKVLEIASPEKWRAFFSQAARLMTLN